MDYKIVKKEAFTVIGMPRPFPTKAPKKLSHSSGKEHYETGKGAIVMGTRHQY